LGNCAQIFANIFTADFNGYGSSDMGIKPRDKVISKYFFYLIHKKSSSDSPVLQADQKCRRADWNYVISGSLLQIGIKPKNVLYAENT